jgi:predicted phage tail protein
MIYKMLPIQDDAQIYARIDEDGLCRVTCIAQNPEFQEAIKNGAELQDAEGNVIDGIAYLEELV